MYTLPSMHNHIFHESDVGNVVNALYKDEAPPTVLIGHRWAEYSAMPFEFFTVHQYGRSYCCQGSGCRTSPHVSGSRCY